MGMSFHPSGLAKKLYCLFLKKSYTLIARKNFPTGVLILIVPFSFFRGGLMHHRPSGPERTHSLPLTSVSTTETGPTETTAT